MNRFEGLKDINGEIMPMVRDRIEKCVRQGEEDAVWNRLDKKEYELDTLEKTHPNLVSLVKDFVDGLTSVVQNQLGPENVVWFRHYCLGFFLEALGAVAETYRRA